MQRLDEGFYGSKGHLIVILMGSIFAVYLSSSLLGKEEDDKTIEYLLSKPITRNEIYCAKYMAFVTIITMFNIVIAMLMASGIYAFANAPVDWEIVTLLAVTPLILHLTFGTICFAISTLFKKVRLVIVLSLDMFYRIIQVSMVKEEVAFEFKMESGIVVQAFGELYNEFKAELEVDYNRYVLLTNELLLKNIDYSKFKEDVNVNKVLEIIIYVSKGLNNKFIAQYKGDYKEIMKNTVKIRDEALSYMDIIIKE